VSNKNNTKKAHSSVRSSDKAKAGKRAGSVQVPTPKVNLNKVFGVLRTMTRSDILHYEQNRAIQTMVEIEARRAHLNTAEVAELKARIVSVANKFRQQRGADLQQLHALSSRAHQVLAQKLGETS
jgi:hypothetical protein